MILFSIVKINNLSLKIPFAHCLAAKIVLRLLFSSLQFFNMSSSDLQFMKTNPKFIFFTDFDGTITLQDSE